MDISIIICAYNPQQRIFEKCLKAVTNLRRGVLDVEILLVDNNSATPLNEIAYVSNFLLQCPGARYISETKAGLTYARIAGFMNARAPVFVLFDDDNVPEENYLLGIKDFVDRVPPVGVFGPGIVSVDYIDGSNKWLETKKETFQEQHMNEEQWDNKTDKYPDYYPFGTGMVIKRKVAEAYTQLVSEQNEVSDRRGNQLMSGGDMQITLTALKNGYAAGRTPLLKIDHLISSNRTTDKYIKKLHYSLGYSNLKAYLGVFPEARTELAKKKPSVGTFYFVLIKSIFRNMFNRRLLLTQLIPSFLGRTSAYYYAFDEKRPVWVETTEKLFGVNYYN